MKTNELARTINTAAQWLNATQTRELLDIAHEIANASYKHLKKSKQVFIIRRERISRPSVHYEAVASWYKCNDAGEPLTTTGRVMTAKHAKLGYK